MNLNDFLAHLKQVRRSGDSWTARCPAHDDRIPSLNIREKDGKILVHCFAECTVEAICAALRIEVRDLFPQRAESIGNTQSSEWGNRWTDGQPLGKPIAVYDYTDENAAILSQVGRFERVSKGERQKTFRQRRPDGKGGWTRTVADVRRVLYQLPAVRNSEFVLVVEGEKDADNAKTLGLTATCNVGGAGKWSDAYAEHLRGKRVTIVSDADEPGRKHAAQVATSLIGKVPLLKVIELPGAKDLSAWIERGGTREAIGELIANAPEWKHRLVPSVSTITRPFSEIKPQILRWLWRDRIPLGKVTLLIGDPGLGKSLLTLDIAARVTRGLPFPDNAICAKGSVIMATGEDDLEDTVRPRLDAANADTARIYALEGLNVVQPNGNFVERPFQLEVGISALEDMLTQKPDVRLIIVDPVSAFMGTIDSNNNAEVRGLLSPLAALASRHHVAILCVSHLRKSAGVAVHRAISSIAFAAAARACLAVAVDPSDPERRLMLPVKQNLSSNVGGLAFRVNTANSLPTLRWDEGTVTISADDVLGGMGIRTSRNAQDEAETFLTRVLSSGPMKAEVIIEKAKAAGISEPTLRRAKAGLGVKAKKSGFGGVWQWSLEDAPDEDAQVQDANLSPFGKMTENTADQPVVVTEGAHENDLSAFERGEL